jgi:hypothetical protein
MTGLEQVTSPLVLGGAYGRRYSHWQDALKDWQAGKDFRILPFGPYCSIRDLVKMQSQFCNIYIQLTKGELVSVEMEA